MTDTPATVIGGRYELIEPIGEGGMAVVWRAQSRGAAGFSRPVAVKRMLPSLNRSPQSVAMFVEEARVGTHLHHPNIVQVHDFGVDDQGAYYLVMEWVNGLTLAKFVESFTRAGRQVPWPLVGAIGVDVLRGLSAAHRRVGDNGRPAPVYHRDVTPQNILLGVDGTVKLSDFGLARAMDRGSMTEPNIVKGKLAYLAPELVLGQPCSAQTDLFAVGIVLWEALSGRRLFEGKNDIQVLLAVRDAAVPPIEQLRPQLPAAFAAAVHMALAQDPTNRFASAQEMGRALGAILREVAEPNDAYVLGQSVAEAQLGSEPPRC